MYTLTQVRSIPSEDCKDSLDDVPDPGHFCTRIVIFAWVEVERAGREHFFFDSYFGDAHVDDSRVSREKTKTLQITWHDRIRCDAMQHDLTRRVTRVLSGKPRSRIHVPMSEFFFFVFFSYYPARIRSSPSSSLGLRFPFVTLLRWGNHTGLF